MGSVTKQGLIALLLVGALLGACGKSEPITPALPTPVGTAPEPNPPAPSSPAPGSTAPEPAPPSTPPVVSSTPGLVTRISLKPEDLATRLQPGLILVDAQTGQIELWTLTTGAANQETGIAPGSYQTADGRFILLRTMDQRRILVERATGETWSWSMGDWNEYVVEDEQLLLSPSRNPGDGYLALRYADRSFVTVAPPEPSTDWADWSPTGLGAQYGSDDSDVPTLMIKDRTGEPQYRIRNASTPCSWFNVRSSAWTADGSALMVSTAQGNRLIKLSGEILPLPYDEIEAAVPSPVDKQKIATLGRIDGDLLLAIRSIETGRTLLSVQIPWEFTVDIAMPRWHPSGQWVQLGMHTGGGKGYDCPWIDLQIPPQVDQAPFKPIQYQVQQTGDCLMLRKAPSRTADPVDCLHDGTPLMPTRHGDGAFRQRDDTGALWLHVEAGGKQGWVIADEGYLGWAP